MSLMVSVSWIAFFPEPLAPTAFRFFDPMTAPIPVRPAAWCRSCMTQALTTKRSPARPIAAQRALSSPTSALRASSICTTSLPHTFFASRISTSSSVIQMYTGFCDFPSTTRASYPVRTSSTAKKPPTSPSPKPPVRGLLAPMAERPLPDSWVPV